MPYIDDPSQPYKLPARRLKNTPTERCLASRHPDYRMIGDGLFDVVVNGRRIGFLSEGNFMFALLDGRLGYICEQNAENDHVKPKSFNDKAPSRTTNAMRYYLGQQFGVRNGIDPDLVQEFAQQAIEVDAGIHGAMDPQESRFIKKMMERIQGGQRALTARGDLIVPCGERTKDGRLQVDIYAGDAQQPSDRIPFSEGLVATGAGGGETGLQRLRIIKSRDEARSLLSTADRQRIERVLYDGDLEALRNEADHLDGALDYPVAAVTLLGTWNECVERLQEVLDADQEIPLLDIDVANINELLDRGNNLIHQIGRNGDRQLIVREQPDLTVAAGLASDIRSLLEQADAIAQRIPKDAGQ